MSVRFIILDKVSGHFHVPVDTEECPVSQLRETGLCPRGGSSAEGFAWETHTRLVFLVVSRRGLRPSSLAAAKNNAPRH